jgi:hypothetical protein
MRSGKAKHVMKRRAAKKKSEEAKKAKQRFF